MTDSNERDMRQLRLILQVIEALEGRRMSFDKFTASLEALVACLEDAPKGWRSSFLEECWTVEQAYAVALDLGQDISLLHEDSDVVTAVEKMKGLVSTLLSAGGRCQSEAPGVGEGNGQQIAP